MHVEIQLFSRGWIKKTILPTPPLSSTCFNPSSIEASAYNTTLAHAPSFVELHSGIGLSLGNDCFNFASTIPQHPVPGMSLPRHTIFHTYWRADLLPLGARQVSLLHSLLAMQDPRSTSVILWTNADVPSHLASYDLLEPLLELYGRRFSVRTIDKRGMAQGTPMEGHKLLQASDARAWLDGDLVRVLVLWAKGGIWVDMDTIMTGRDVRVLGEAEWVTQWDCYGASDLLWLSLGADVRADKIYQPLNGAMMHFYRNSPFLCEMLYAMANDPAPRQGTTDWGSRLYHKVWRRLLANSIKPFKILPYCFTDGHNCRLDNRLPDSFGKSESGWGKGRAEELRTKVESVFAVHLHNQWDKEFPQKGWVRTLILSKVEEAVKRYRGSDEAEGEEEKEER